MAVTSDGTPYVEPGDAISAYPVVSQELAAVIDSLRTMIHPGTIFPYAGRTAPEGYLLCDGKAYTRTDFYDLYQVMSDWVGQWGGFPNGDSTLFFVPDMRGRSPIGVGGSGIAREWQIGERWGDGKTGWHLHDIQYNREVTTPVGPVDGGTANYGVQVQANTSGNAFRASGATTAPADGVGGNYHPSTGVNFIVWTGTTTAGKTPVPGVELPPLTTRMMIEARLEEAGIGEEEIEMLREQLAALKEDTNG